jgi:YbbR domain-containing protein
MREFLRARVSSADLIRLVSSLVLAFLLWGWVTTREDPQITRTFPNLPIQVPELPDSLIVVGSLPTVTIEVKGPRSVINRVTSNDVSASLDVDDIDKAADYTVAVEVTAPDGVWKKKSTPSQVQIHIETSVTQQFSIVTKVAGTLNPSRRVGQISPDPSEVTVRGPQSVVSRIDHIELPIEIGERARDFTGTFNPVAVDSSGQQLTGVAISPDTVTASVQIEAAGKSVAVFTQLVGSPAEGFDVVDRTVNPSTVLVDGPQKLLDGLVVLQTEPVDITGARENVSIRVGLEGLPDGVTIVDPADGLVQVSIQIGQRGVRQALQGLQITFANLGSGLEADASPQDATVVVVAAEDVLGQLKASDLMIQVDLAGLGPGVYVLEPSVSLPPNVQWISTDPQTVTVTIRRIAGTAPIASPVASPSAARNEKSALSYWRN